MVNKYFKLLIILLVLAIIVPQVALAAWWNPFSWNWGRLNNIFHFKQTEPPSTNSGQENQEQKQVACTMEAKQCPDGSYVGREGPNCEFKDCPETKKDETSNWKTYTNTYYDVTLKYPDRWKAEDLPKACMESINGSCDNPSDFIAPGINVISLDSYDPLTNPDKISIFYGSYAGSTAGCTKIKNINIGDKIFSQYTCGGVSDIVSYINKIKNTQGDILTGKYTAGPYFNDAFYIEYIEVGPRIRIAASLLNYKLGFAVLTELKNYYKKNNSLPPDISAITPDIWCYDMVTKNQSLLGDEEKITQQILSTFKFTK